MCCRAAQIRRRHDVADDAWPEYQALDAVVLGTERPFGVCGGAGEEEGCEGCAEGAADVEGEGGGGCDLRKRDRGCVVGGGGEV